jgi:5-methylcytosine-specific restriction endonuclease McrBC regulatory subunit McrC
MNKLFERFVTQVLRERAQAHVTVDDQVPVYLGSGQKVLMQPDIVVSEGERTVLVADCKYKRIEPSQFKNHDMYQMLAYCTATQVQRGLLIYPVHSAVIQDEVAICNTHTVVRRITVDLGKEYWTDLDRECSAFAGEVLDSVLAYAGHSQLL